MKNSCIRPLSSTPRPVRANQPIWPRSSFRVFFDRLWLPTGLQWLQHRISCFIWGRKQWTMASHYDVANLLTQLIVRVSKSWIFKQARKMIKKKLFRPYNSRVFWIINRADSIFKYNAIDLLNTGLYSIGNRSVKSRFKTWRFFSSKSVEKLRDYTE